MIRRPLPRWAILPVVLALAACQSTGGQPSATTISPSSAPMANRAGALFYTKAGALYVSQPAGSAGRKLTEGPADTQPAPSPDGSHVAFVRKAKADDYGGELWVLDLSAQLAPAGSPRRLVERSALPQGTDETPPMVVSPRWSPTGTQVAFLDNTSGGMVDGGRLLAVAADTGALVPGPQQPFAESRFAWAPDGRHITWTQARSDVRPVDVNALAVGGASAPVATDTNAYSVTFTKDGRSILFTNGDASGPDFATIPFALRTGGIYSVSTEAGGKPPVAVLAKPNSYFSDIAALDNGALAFTAQGAGDSSKVIQVMDRGSSAPRTTVTDVAAAGQGPEWSGGDFVAYLDSSSESALFATDLDNRNPKRVDTGVDSFAWVP